MGQQSKTFILKNVNFVSSHSGRLWKTAKYRENQLSCMSETVLGYLPPSKIAPNPKPNPNPNPNPNRAAIFLGGYCPDTVWNFFKYSRRSTG